MSRSPSRTRFIATSHERSLAWNIALDPAKKQHLGHAHRTAATPTGTPLEIKATGAKPYSSPRALGQRARTELADHDDRAGATATKPDVGHDLWGRRATSPARSTFGPSVIVSCPERWPQRRAVHRLPRVALADRQTHQIAHAFGMTTEICAIKVAVCLFSVYPGVLDLNRARVWVLVASAA